MSAVPTQLGIPQIAGVRPGRRKRHLLLLPGGAVAPATAPVRPASTGTGRAGLPASRIPVGVGGAATTHVDVPVPPATPARLVLTQRGRLAATLLGAAIVTLIALVAWGPQPAASVAPTLPAPGASSARVVVRGETLSGIALATMPERPVADGVHVLQKLNGLGTSTTIYAGQTILVPAA